jgi:hypothetical protein
LGKKYSYFKLRDVISVFITQNSVETNDIESYDIELNETELINNSCAKLDEIPFISFQNKTWSKSVIQNECSIK